jgi:lipoprotein-anchoring transpeptidase ErfK/SrfK
MYSFVSVLLCGVAFYPAAQALAQASYATPDNRRIADERYTGRQTLLPMQAMGRYDRPASSNEPGQGQLGGGFIEMILTGRDPQRSRPNSYYNVPPETITRQALRAPVASRRSLAHNVPDDDLNDPMELPRQSRQRLAALSPVEDDYRPIQRAIPSQFQRQIVDYDSNHKAGTVVIDTENKFLYLVESKGKAVRYGIGVGRPGFEWAGVKTVTRKAEWPDWRPPEQMLKRRPDLPTFMKGGPDNPLGARAMYLGSSLYRIHGTNEPHTIGQAVSSGCIRMLNKDVIDLYGRVKVGTKVIVI